MNHKLISLYCTIQVYIACAEPSHSREPNARLPSNFFATNPFKNLVAAKALKF